MNEIWKKLEIKLKRFYAQEDFEKKVFTLIGKSLLVLVPTLFLGPTLIVTVAILPTWISFFIMESYARYRPDPNTGFIWLLSFLVVGTLCVNIIGLYTYLKTTMEFLISLNVFGNYFW